MREDNDNFATLNGSASKSLRIAVKIPFDDASTDVHWFTSHADTLLPVSASSIVSGSVKNITVSSQRFNPIESIFSIGNIQIEAVDVRSEVTALMNAKWLADRTTSQKIVEVYIGFAELTSFDDYALVQTQVLGNIVAGKSSYVWSCTDIQRFLKKEIFQPYKTNLRASITPTDTFIPVVAAVDYMTLHDSTYDDAPNDTVGYLEIEGEVIRYSSVVTTPGAQGYNVDVSNPNGRGALGTKPAAHEIDSDSSTAESNQPLVEEVIYFMGAAPKLAKKLLLGSHSSETFPDHWQLELDAAFVASSQFENIGADWWDTATDTGVFLRFVKPKPQDGKKFIEKEIMLPIGGFMPVGADGQLGLRRMTGVLSTAPTEKDLDLTNIVNYSDITYDQTNIRNVFVIQWNWDERQEAFTRNVVLPDTVSQAKFSKSKEQRLAFRGVHGSRTTEEVLVQQLDALRDRYAGYPKKMRVEVLPSLNVLEPGDIVRVKLPQVQDHTDVTAALDSAFEVQSVSLDWIRGTVVLELFGSSFQATSSLRIAQQNKQPLSWYQSQGTDLSTVLTIDGFGEIADGQTLTGGATMAAGIYYYDGNLTLPSANTLTITDNIQLRVRGFVDIQGKIDGEGRGHAGGAAVVALSGSQGVTGFTGSTTAGGGVDVDTRSHAFHTDEARVYSVFAPATKGANTGAPILPLRWEGGVLFGLEGDLRPSSGGGGGGGAEEGNPPTVTGGAGGAGGAALAIICQGFDSTGADIDLDGSPGLTGQLVRGYSGLAFHSGSGASGCGGPIYVILDGNTSTAGNIALSSIRPDPAYSFDTDADGNPLWAPSSDWKHDQTSGGIRGSYYRFSRSENNSASNQRIQYLPNDADAQTDVSRSTGNVDAVLADQVLNTDSRTTKIVNLEISVTEPSDGNYSHSVAYLRVDSGSGAWTEIGVIPNGGEIIKEVAADGTTWEVQARSVSILGVESPSGPTTTLTVINLINPTQPTGQSDASTINGQIPVPDVTGLEIFGQGNNQEFAGRDCKITWNKVAGVSSVDFGSEPEGLGAGSGQEDYYFDFYVVAVYDSDSGALLRTELAKDNNYIYSYEKNNEDFIRVKGQPLGSSVPPAFRNIRFELVVRTFDNRESAKIAKLSVSNPKPAIMGATVFGFFQRVTFKATPSADTDFQGIRIWVSTTQGFTPDASTLVADSENIEVDINGLLSGTVYYLRFSPYDSYGPDDTNLSSEISVTTQATLKAVAGTAGDKVAIGGAFVATAGLAWADIDPGDTVTIPNGTWRLDMGPVSDGPTTYVVRFHDGQGDSTFSIDADGNVSTVGSVAVKVSGTERIKLDSTNESIWINDATFTNEGIQFEYNLGTPRAYIGDGAEKFLKFDGTDLELGRDTQLVGADAYNNENVYYTNYFDTIDGLGQQTSGASSAFILNTVDGALLNIRAGNGSTGEFAELSKWLRVPQIVSWSSNKRLKVHIQLTGAGVYYIKMADNVSTSNQVYCRIDNRAIKLVNVDSGGGSNIVDTLTSFPTGLNEIEIVWNGTQSEIYLNGSSIGTNSSNLPTGTTNATHWNLTTQADPTLATLPSMLISVLKYLDNP